MSLLVVVSRAPAEPWGFRLIGGAEYTMPLTIVKIQPGTAAEASGLLHGDTLMSINGQDAASMRHEEAYNAIKESGELMELEVVRGHYDMVLEEEYSEVQQEDSDLPSDPTEVLPTEPPSLDSDIIPIPELELLKPQVMNADGTRSQTASPFVLPTKPYRPFSTEPIQEVPDLENPIILNPGYHDEFGIVKEVLIDDIGILKGCEDYLPKTRFKLPVSEQYDPEFGKEKKGKEEIKGKKKEEGRSFVSEVAYTSLTEYKSVEEKVTREEIRFMEQMKKDIDLDRIEETANLDQRVQQTAINVVEDSITKAVIVAEEIKKEIDVELMSSKTEDVKNSVVVADEIKKLNEVELLSLDSRKEEKSCTKVKSDVKYVESKVNSTDLVTKGFVIKKESQSEQSEKADRVELKEEQHVSSAKQEMEETIVAGSVKRLTTNFNQESELNTNDKKEATQQTVATAQKRTADVKQDVKKSNVETNRTAVKQESNIQHNHVETKVSSAESKTTKTSQKTEPTGLKNGQKMSTSRLLAEQRAYTIGLQTIPNIRGNVHSSYHYDLLLKTFFIHLTDVMVALSRFILAEPVLSQSDNKTEHVATEEYIQKEKAETKFQVKDMPTEQIQAEIKEVEEKPCVKKFVKQRMEIESDKIEVENQVIDKNKSGCKMAQLTEHKPEELTNKMDAVITEFQTKAGIEEEVFEVDARKETEVATLEESSKMKTNKTEIKEISSEMICSIKESNETNRDSRSESRSGKTTYTAIVESHVYTNKDAIFEEQFSETSSLQNGDAVSISELIENAAESKSVETVADETQKFSVIEAVESLAKIVEANTLRENKVEKCKETSLQTSHESVIAETVQQENTSSKVEAVKINEEKIKSVETVADKSQQYSVIEAVESSAKIVEANTLQDNKVEKCKDMSLQTSHKSVIAETVQQENTSSKVEAVEINENKIKSSIEESREAYTSTALSETQKFKTEDIKSDSNGIEKVVLSELIVEKAKEILIVEPTDEPKADVEVEVMMIRPPSRKPSKVMAEDVQATIQKLKEVSPAKETFTTIQSDMEVTSTTKTEFSNMSEVKHRKKESEVIQTRQELEVFESKQKSEVRKTEQEIKVLETKQEIKTNQTKQEKEVMQTTQDSLTAKREARAESLSRLTLDLKEESPKKLTSQDSFTSTIDTPTPASVPPTPITDEYMFRINTPLPKCTGPQPDPETPSPEKEIDHEDFGIVKKKLNPYIETEIERTVYDLPLPTPIEVKDAPVFGAAERSKSLSERSSEEEIREIERTSSLLASVINETIKSIEEYKEQVGMETRREDREEIREKIRAETKPMYSSFVNEPVTTIYAEVKPVTKETTIIDAISDLGKYNTRRASQTETVSLTGMNESMTEISSQATEKTSSIITRQMSSAAQEMSSRATQELQESSETSQSEVKEIKGYRPVVFDQEELRQKSVERDEQRLAGFRSVQLDIQEAARVSVPRELVQEGETLATRQGIISGLADRGAQDSNELGKPGISEKKIAEIVSGESEMLREAHVMGLKRVIASHMTRPGDSSIDFNKIKPVIDSLKDSAVLAALNDELTKTKEEKKKDERKWTTFLQKPERPTPKAKFGYHGWLPQFDPKQKPYKVEIKKQPKPKVAPDYKPERAGFETGALPWEERAANEPPQPPLPAEDPILIPEQEPEFYEAVDPMPESEVPDLEETGIPLPPERTEEDTAPAAETVNPEELEPDAPAPAEEEKAQEPEVTSEEMEQSRLAEQLLNNVQGMVDPNATLEQQLSQMRAQLAALAQLPGVIQQTLELVSKQLMQLTQTETKVVKETTEVVEQVEVTKTETVQEVSEETQVSHTQEQTIRAQEQTNQTQEQSQTTVAVQEVKQEISAEEVELKRRQEEELMRSEKEKKEQEELARLEHESRQVKHHPTPRAGKPKPAFGPLVPQERPIVLTGGRKWRKPKDAYNDQFYTEQLAAQAEIIQGNTKGFSYESVLLPYDERINFMKYEKPPVSLDHLQRSDVYKMIHNMEQVPLRRTDLLTPVVAECDYREKCRSMSPCVRGMERCNMP